MPPRNQSQQQQMQQQQIADLVDACASYWELRGIPAQDCALMQLELTEHVHQALSDGKTLADVVGSNPAALAEAWAREMQPSWLRGGTLVARGFLLSLCLLSGSALGVQLLARTTTFTLTLVYPILFLNLALGSLLLRWSGFFSSHIALRRHRVVLAAVVLGLPLLVIGVLQCLDRSFVNWQRPLLTWSWPVTALLLLGSLTLIALGHVRTGDTIAAARLWQVHSQRQHGLVLQMTNLLLFAVALVVANQLLVVWCTHI